MIAFVEVSFESAHRLPNVDPSHKCYNLHGHSYKVKIKVEGFLDPVLGWIQDFSDIRKAFESIRVTLDHKLLNDIPGLSNPTSEILAVWMYDKLKPSIPLLKSVTVMETSNSGCEYDGNS